MRKVIGSKKQEMRNRILNYINQFLDERTDVFLNEKDLQFYLVRKLIDTNTFDKVYIDYEIKTDYLPEFYGDYIWKNDRKIVIDILIKNDGVFYPINVNYRTINTLLNEKYLIFEETNYVLNKNKAPHSIVCYNIWKGVRTLELLNNHYYQFIERGITIFITNDFKYSSSVFRNDCQFRSFAFSEALINEVRWENATENRLNKYPNFELTYTYECEWRILNIITKKENREVLETTLLIL